MFLKTSIAPQKWWLENVIFLLRRSIFRGYVSFREDSILKIDHMGIYSLQKPTDAIISSIYIIMTWYGCILKKRGGGGVKNRVVFQLKFISNKFLGRSKPLTPPKMTAVLQSQIFSNLIYIYMCVWKTLLRYLAVSLCSPLGHRYIYIYTHI